MTLELERQVRQVRDRHLDRQARDNKNLNGSRENRIGEEEGNERDCESENRTWLLIACRGQKKSKAKMIEILSSCDRYHWHYRSESLSVICKLVDCVCADISHQKNDWFVWMSKLGLSVHQKGG